MPKMGIKRLYYRSGQIHTEIRLLNRHFHGLHRTWHRNGQLAQELRYRYGLLHGTSRQWSENGRLFGSFTMVHGTGLQRYWHDNGQIQTEISTLTGKFHGRVRSWLRDGTLATGPAEQRTVELSDGTRVSLNANSRVVVQYDDRVRKVTLTSGEALFDVTKHEPRPFVVVIGDRKVIAVGTSFVVRREEPAGPAFAVTLVEGRVAIEPISWPDELPSNTVMGLNLLNPGERLRFADTATEVRDSPSIDKVTAWQRGQLVFDDASLSEAVAEFNRYGSHKMAIDDPVVGKLRVGGVFRIGDPSSFAQAMANAYHLRIVNRGNTIVLTAEPAESKQKIAIE